MNRKLFYKEKGITMVSLVITIIILLILSSIALKTVIGENGLIEKSQQITKEYENTELREKEGIEELYDQLKWRNKKRIIKKNRRIRRRNRK